MRSARHGGGLPAPLLDRLMDLGSAEADEPGTPWVLEGEELRASVRREVAHVLGTRCKLSLKQAESLELHERSALDYGLPDLRTLGSASEEARSLERIIARAVEAYEPRLRQIQVSVRLPPEVDEAVVGVLTAQLAQELILEPLSLTLRLGRSTRMLEVGDER
jgi:type VI secretion system protein ImpF